MNAESLGDRRDARIASVKTLQEFYSVIVAFAFISGVQTFVASLERGRSGHQLPQLMALSVAGQCGSR